MIGHLYKEGGIRSIYRGTFATMARDGPGSAACVYLTCSPCPSFQPSNPPKDTSRPMKSRKRHLHQPTHLPRTSTLVKLSSPVGPPVWPCGPLLFPQMSAAFGIRPAPGSHDADLSAGSKIKVAICAHRDVYWYLGLCTEDYRRGWCEGTVEGVWTSHGTSKFLNSKVSIGV